MEIDRRVICDRFTEVVAKTLDLYDQRQQGKYPPYDYESWKKRYIGKMPDELPPFTVEFNTFKPTVDGVVAQLMMALDDDAWERGKRPAFPGLTGNQIIP